MSPLLRTAALAFALVAPAAAAQTTTFTVNSTADDSNARDVAPGDGQCVDAFTQSNPDAEPRCTLRAAIDEANATAGAVVINLPGQLAGGASGTYTLARVAPNVADNTYEDDNAYGDLDVGGSGALFTSLEIRGTGTPGPQVTISPNDRVFHLLSGTVAVSRVTVTGGTARPGDNGSGNPGPDEMVDGEDGEDGGCFLVEAGVTATFEQLSVNNCVTSSGGNGAVPATAIARTRGGDAGDGGRGGGIANFGTLTVRKSFVSQNGTGDAGGAASGQANTGSSPAAGGNGGNGGLGGGIFNAGDLTVEQSTVTGNGAGDPSVGGGGVNGGADGYDGEGGSGGGIATIDGGSTSLANSIVAGNAAGDDVNNPDGNGSFVSKQPGSDLFDGDPADDDTVDPAFPGFTTGTYTDDGFNLIGTNDTVAGTFPDSQPGTAVDQNGSIVGSGQAGDASRVDPVVTGANRNGTYAVTAYEIGATSPAIDAADPAIGGTSPTVDGRGFRRPEAGTDTRADIGAFERDSSPVQGALVVNELDTVTAPATEDDQAEFVEIRNTSTTATAQLADYALVFYSGADDKAYAAVNLAGELAPGAVVVVGDPALMGQSPSLFTGAPDDVRDEDGAVGLYLGKASDYPVGAVAGQNASTRVDVVVYDNGTQASRRRDASSLADAFGQSQADVATGDTEGTSLQRTADGGYQASAPSPGADTTPPSAPTDVVVNEVDSDTPGSDTAEFVELLGPASTPLDGLVLVFINGGDDASYRSIDLDGIATDASGRALIANAAVTGADVTFPNGGLQNGPDAVALYVGDAADYPNDTPASTTNLVNAVAYGTSDARDAGLLTALGLTVQFDESYRGTPADDSVQRLNNDAFTGGTSALFYADAPTPDADNPDAVTAAQGAVDDLAAYRLLSTPVANGFGADAYTVPQTPLRVDFLAGVNLVQGVPAGTPAGTFEAQYPAAEAVVFTDYAGASSYTAASSADEELPPGAGFFWYWFDNDVVPPSDAAGGGTSRSFDLDGSTGFALTATGIPLDDQTETAVAGASTDLAVTVPADGFVLLGNPFAYPFYLGGFEAQTGTLQSAFSAYDPSAGSYVTLTASTGTLPSGDAVDVWQGVVGEVSGATGAVTISADDGAVDPTTGPAFYGRTAAAEADERQLRLALTGTTADGTALADLAPLVRLRADAEAGWDRHDGTKLAPPQGEVALLALVGTRDGEPTRQAALSLPDDGAARTVPLAVRATAPGSYRVTWDGAAGLDATFRDRRTGAAVALDAAAEYAFTLDAATDWTDRFELVLGDRAVAAVDDPAAAAEVSAVYPNPSAGAAALDVGVPTAQTVTVAVFDALGRRVWTARRALTAGAVEAVRFEGATLAPGVYVVRVAGDGVEATRRLTVAR